MVIKALLVAFVYYITCFLNIGLGAWHFNRPIIIGPLVGLVLGDLKTGIILGATFEAVFLGVIAIGGSMPADPAIGSLFGTAIAIIAGLDSETALAVAVPVSMVGMFIGYAPMTVIFPILSAKSQKHAANGDTRGLARMSLIMALVMPLGSAIISFFGIYLGAEAVGGLLASLPPILLGGLAGAGAIMPAVGMAMLLNLLYDKKIVAFFFFGFVLSIYLGLESIAIAVIAVVIGIYTYYNMPKTTTALPGVEGVAKISEEEDFFE